LQVARPVVEFNHGLDDLPQFGQHYDSSLFLRQHINAALAVVLSFIGARQAALGQIDASALRALEARAEAEFSRRDHISAAKTYQQAADMAGASSTRLDFYFRRLGICDARLGDLPAALVPYQRGVEASGASGEKEVLAENIHGAALTLQKPGLVAGVTRGRDTQTADWTISPDGALWDDSTEMFLSLTTSWMSIVSIPHS
jgi:hypothetical protein